MFNNLISNYINKLSINDIKIFSLKNNIYLNDKEINYVYNVLKKDYKKLLSNNYDIVFHDAKKYIENDNLKKIYNLYLDYRLKYQNFIN